MPVLYFFVMCRAMPMSRPQDGSDPSVFSAFLNPTALSLQSLQFFVSPFFHHLYPLTTLSGSFQQLRASMSLCLLDDGPDEITQFSLECSRSCQTFHLARPTHIHRVAWGLGAVLSTWTWVHGHGYMDIEMRSTCTCTCSLVGVHATLPQSPY